MAILIGDNVRCPHGIGRVLDVYHWAGITYYTVEHGQGKFRVYTSNKVKSIYPRRPDDDYAKKERVRLIESVTAAMAGADLDVDEIKHLVMATADMYNRRAGIQ